MYIYKNLSRATPVSGCLGLLLDLYRCQPGRTTSACSEGVDRPRHSPRFGLRLLLIFGS